MLPKEFIDGGPNDIRMRLTKSIIMLGGDPVYCYSQTIKTSKPGSRKSKPHLQIVDRQLKTSTVPVDSARLFSNDLGANLGFMNLADSTCIMLLQRLPVRRYCQGLNSVNTAAVLYTPHLDRSMANRYAITNAANNLGLHGVGRLNGLNIPDVTELPYVRSVENLAGNVEVDENLLYTFHRPEFKDMWHNRYPSVKAALDKKKSFTAVGRRYFVDTTKPTPLLHSMLTPRS
jgi:hypothetical protein